MAQPANRVLSRFIAADLYSMRVCDLAKVKNRTICIIVHFGEIGRGGYFVANCLCHLNLLCPFYVSLWFYGQTFIYSLPRLGFSVTPIAFDYIWFA